MTENQVVLYTDTRAKLALLKEEYKDKQYDCTTKEGMIEAREIRRKFVTCRTDLEKSYKALSKDPLDYLNGLRDQKKELLAEVTPLEARPDVAIKAQEEVMAEAKRVKAEAEKERIVEIQTKLSYIRDIPLTLTKHSSESLLQEMDALKDWSLDDDFYQEFIGDAHTLLAETIQTIENMYKNAVLSEDADRKKKAEQEAEDKRLEALKNIQMIREVPTTSALGQCSAEIKEFIVKFKDGVLNPDLYGVLLDEAIEVKSDVVDKLELLLKAEIKLEADAEQRIKDQAEIDRKNKEHQDKLVADQKAIDEKREAQETEDRKRKAELDEKIKADEAQFAKEKEEHDAKMITEQEQRNKQYADEQAKLKADQEEHERQVAEFNAKEAEAQEQEDEGQAEGDEVDAEFEFPEEVHYMQGIVDFIVLVQKDYPDLSGTRSGELIDEIISYIDNKIKECFKEEDHV